MIDGFEHLNLIKHQDHIIEKEIDDGASIPQTLYEESSYSKVGSDDFQIPRILT